MSVEDLERMLDRSLKELALSIARLLDMRVEKVLESLSLARRSETLDIVRQKDGEIVGLRLKVPSRSHRDVFYYVSIGIYGFKCNCEASSIKGSYCICPVCGHKRDYTAGTVCSQEVCPKCGSRMTRPRESLCAHVIAGLFVWHMISFVMFGKSLDLSKLRWLVDYEHGRRDERESTS